MTRINKVGIIRAVIDTDTSPKLVLAVSLSDGHATETELKFVMRNKVYFRFDFKLKDVRFYYWYNKGKDELTIVKPRETSENHLDHQAIPIKIEKIKNPIIVDRWGSLQDCRGEIAGVGGLSTYRREFDIYKSFRNWEMIKSINHEVV